VRTLVERKLNAPDAEYLTDEQAAGWLSVHVEDFREYVRQGLIPRGIPYGKRLSSHRWPWMDVVAIGHLLSRGHLKLPGNPDTDTPK